MHRRSSVEATKPSYPQFLNPVLRLTLENLDVTLDEELARYRRLRDRRSERATRLRQRHLTEPEARVGPSGLNSADFTDERHWEGEAIAFNAANQPEPPSIYAAAAPLAMLRPEDNYLTSDDDLESSEDLLSSIIDEEDLRADQEPGMVESLLTPLGIGSMLLLLLSSISFGYFIMNPASLSRLGLEKLWTRSSPVASPTATIPSSPVNPSTAVTSPNLADQEFVEINPGNLSTLPRSNSTQNPDQVSPATISSLPSPTVTQPLAPSAPQEPPPQAEVRRSVPQEPPAVSRRSPAAANSSSQPSTTTSTRRTPSRSSRSSGATSQPPSVNDAPAPARPPATPEPAVSPQPPSPPGPVAVRQSELYYVVTEYTGDRTLEQVRQVTGDAFVRNSDSGARIQAGAFSDQQRAQELVQELQNQGIPAQVVNPNAE